MNKQELAESFAANPGMLAGIVGATTAQISEHTKQTRRISQGQTPSRAWEKLKFHCPGPEGAQVYGNKLYMVTLRVYSTGWIFNSGPWAQMGIWTTDGQVRHDWRDFQRIKNDLVGAEWEAIELYPAESRLLDPSNYWILYAAPAIPIGKYEGRTILGPDNCVAPQRGWAKGDEPPELRKKTTP